MKPVRVRIRTRNIVRDTCLGKASTIIVIDENTNEMDVKSNIKDVERRRTIIRDFIYGQVPDALEEWKLKHQTKPENTDGKPRGITDNDTENDKRMR